jgi:hypothetical protein
VPHLSLEQVQALCKRDGIATRSEYITYVKSHKNCGLPFNPDREYKTSWNALFGKIKTRFMTLRNAQAFCQRKRIDSYPKYRAYWKSHKNHGLPSHPNRRYKISWKRFFGRAPFISLREAQALCKRGMIDDRSKYKAYRLSHKNCGLPSYPNESYNMRWRQFLGTKRQTFLTFQKAQALCKRKGIDTLSKYHAYRKSHKNCGLRSNPDNFYKHWVGWGEFFGAKPFMTLRKAQAFCKRKRINDTPSYRDYHRSHKNCGLPSDPPAFYEMRWRVFFGKQPRRVGAALLPLRKAKALCTREGLDSLPKYRAYLRSHQNCRLRSNPKGYNMLWREFFGRGRTKHRKRVDRAPHKVI